MIWMVEELKVRYVRFVRFVRWIQDEVDKVRGELKQGKLIANDVTCQETSCDGIRKEQAYVRV